MNHKPLQPSEVSYIIQDQIMGRLPITTFKVNETSTALDPEKEIAARVDPEGVFYITENNKGTGV